MGDNVIKLRRLGRGWSQEQLAEMCGLSVRTIQRIENGDQASLETMSAIAAVFGCDVAQLRATASAEAETTDDGINQRLQEARARLRAENRFWRSVITWLVICAGLGIINVVTDRSVYWFLWPLCLWGGLLLVRGARLFVLHEWLAKREQQRLQQLLKK